MGSATSSPTVAPGNAAAADTEQFRLRCPGYQALLKPTDFWLGTLTGDAPEVLPGRGQPGVQVENVHSTVQCGQPPAVLLCKAAVECAAALVHTLPDSALPPRTWVVPGKHHPTQAVQAPDSVCGATGASQTDQLSPNHISLYQQQQVTLEALLPWRQVPQPSGGRHAHTPTTTTTLPAPQSLEPLGDPSQPDEPAALGLLCAVLRSPKVLGVRRVARRLLSARCRAPGEQGDNRSHLRCRDLAASAEVLKAALQLLAAAR